MPQFEYQVNAICVVILFLGPLRASLNLVRVCILLESLNETAYDAHDCSFAAIAPLGTITRIHLWLPLSMLPFPPFNCQFEGMMESCTLAKQWSGGVWVRFEMEVGVSMYVVALL